MVDLLLVLFNFRVGIMFLWFCNVKMFGGYNIIMDNMINLEMFFWVVKNGGNFYLFDIVVVYVDKMMKYYFCLDYIFYYVVVYDILIGEFIKGVIY